MILDSFAAYVKQIWKNKPDTSTPVSAERLNHMEEGIKEISDALAALAAVVCDQVLNDPEKIASLAALYSVDKKIGDTSKLPNSAADVVTALTTLNSKLSIFSLGRCLTLGASESITFACSAASIFFLYRGVSTADKAYIFAVDNWAIDIERAVEILATDELVTATYADKKLTITNNNAIGLTVMYFTAT